MGGQPQEDVPWVHFCLEQFEGRFLPHHRDTLITIGYFIVEAMGIFELLS